MDTDGGDITVVFEDGYVDDLREFYQRNGAVELISSLRERPKRFEELDEQLDVSRSSIAERIHNARELSLIKFEHRPQDDDVYKFHKLSALGESLSKRMEEIGLSQTHIRLCTIRQEYENYKQEFNDWVENPDGLEERIEDYKHYLNEEDW